VLAEDLDSAHSLAGATGIAGVENTAVGDDLAAGERHSLEGESLEAPEERRNPDWGMLRARGLLADIQAGMADTDWGTG
jgi:hypothetical protein